MSRPLARMVYVHVLSPLHSGTGQSVGVVDLPIAREKATGWPIIPGSSLKGVLRDGQEDDHARQVYGSKDAAGALCFADQRILCLPVRSYFGTFAYVTCPLALSRHARDCAATGAATETTTIPKVSDAGALVCTKTVLARGADILLEDLDLKADPSPAVDDIASAIASAVMPGEKEIFAERFAVVSNLVFDFLCTTATEVTARVALSADTKTARSGGLWYEEAVPSEAVFSGPILAASHREDAGRFLDEIKERVIQLGGKASVGRGLCRLVVSA